MVGTGDRTNLFLLCMTKRYFIFLSLLFSLLLTSCRPEIVKPPKPGEEEPPPPAEFSLVTPVEKKWDGNKRGNITYQLLIYSFADKDGDGTGDIKGLIDKLDYIDEMGASAIWLSPIHPSMSYHGYDVTDFSAINPTFGTMSDFRTLVARAKEKGIKIYLDYVINHTGKDHPWFTTASASLDNPYRDYYIFSSKPREDIASGKIPMIATEGASGYDAGQWFAISTTASTKYLFTLNWSNPSSPTILVTATDSVDPDNPDTSTEGAKYLYFGNNICKKFYNKGGGVYTLKVDFSSSWGFLIRTSSTSWEGGTKYGASSSTNNTITLGAPFTLYTNSTSPSSVHDLLMPGASMYHSHFWTSWFADLNYGAVESAENSPAFKAIVNDAKKWIDEGVDGFRLDAVKHIYHNANSNENPRFLKKFYDELNGYYRKSHSSDIYMVGEVYSEYNEVAPYYVGLPALFEFSFWSRLKWALDNNKGCYFAKDILGYQALYSNYRSDYVEATKLSNHDENRTLSDLGGSIDKAKLAGAILLTSGGSPYIYYGEELGYIGKKTGGDEYVRSPMLWGDKYTTSYTTKIDSDLSKTVGTVVSQKADPLSIHKVYRDFTRARNASTALASGSMTKHPLYNEDNSTTFPMVAAWYRTASSEKVLVLHNLGVNSVTLPLNDVLKDAIAAQGKVYVKKEDGKYQVKLSPYSSVVFEL